MSKNLFKQLGFISKRDVSNLVDSVMEKAGHLNTRLHWNEEQLFNDARQLLKEGSQDEARQALYSRFQDNPWDYVCNLDDLYANLLLMMEENLKSMCYLLSLKRKEIKARITKLSPSLSDEDLMLDCLRELKTKPHIYLNGWADYESVISDLKNGCITELNNEWIVNVPACNEFNVNLVLSADYTPSMVSNELFAAVAGDPYKYLIPYKSIAKEVYEQINQSFASSLPEGYTLNEEQITSELESLIIAGVSFDSLVEALIGKIKTDYYKYVSVKELAKKLLRQIQDALPAGLTISNPMIEEKIEKLIISGASLEELVNKVKEDVVKNPFSFLEPARRETVVDHAMISKPYNNSPFGY